VKIRPLVISVVALGGLVAPRAAARANNSSRFEIAGVICEHKSRAYVSGANVLDFHPKFPAAMRARKTLVWLIPLTFGNGVNESTWVVVGDGAGAYSTQGGQENGDMLYYREDGASQKLPNSIQIFEAKSNLSERPNR
jgi:hypothetical protein